MCAGVGVMYFKLSEGHPPLHSFCINTQRSGDDFNVTKKDCTNREAYLYQRKMSKGFIFSYLDRTQELAIRGTIQVFQGF